MISYIETCERECSFDQLERLCALFNLDLADILEEAENAQTINYAFPFSTNDLTSMDLDSIAHFQLIVKNYMKMNSLANG